MKTIDLFGEYSEQSKSKQGSAYWKEYYAANKEKELLRCKDYYYKNREEKIRKHCEWQKANRERLLEKTRNKNKEKREAYQHLLELKRIGAEWAREIWLEEKKKQRDEAKVINKEKKKLRNKQYKNTQKGKEAQLRRTRNRIIRDPLFRLSRRIRSAIGLHISKRGYTKKSKTAEILGCTFEQFKQHLESKFELWMSWDNYGKFKSGEINYGWDIDHIIPISTAKTEEDVIRLNHYTNLQPMCSHTNRNIKKDKLIKKRN